MASPFDLASLPNLKRWLDITGNDDDDLLARLITQMSRAILNVLDRPSILPATYADTYDGGNDGSILLRQWPVNSILSCNVNGLAISASPPIEAGMTSLTGYTLESSDIGPPGRMQRVSLRGSVFPRGLQNIKITYSAGYQVTNESAVVPVNAPHSLSVLAPYGDFARDNGIIDSNGSPLTLVAVDPGAGQYTCQNGVYTFSGADAGATVFLTYGYVPADLGSCCIEWAAERYAYRSRIGQQSKSLGGQETIAFIVGDVPRYVAHSLQPYRRVITP